MFSIEKPPFPVLTDPPCNSVDVNNNSDDHEKISHTPYNLVSLPDELDHHLPSFTIRDYVFTSRSKDIKKNWPFSVENLQLCHKHGVEDVLPPFQSRDTLGSHCSKKRKLDNCTVKKPNAANFVKEASGLDNHGVLLKRSRGKLNNNELADSCVDISTCRSGQENEFLSTITSVSQFEIDSIRDNVQSSSPISETTAPLKASGEVEAAAVQVNNKTEKPSGKKCRLIVKFGGNLDCSSNEDSAHNCPTVSEAMASKVCPVCKTFSSSSNTTLNAHIDQCLSMDSTLKWVSESRPTRYRIKPRKTRLMVDIYTTAKRCTLEELDRRNGTSWAVFSVPSQENGSIVTSKEEKKQMLSANHPEDIDDVGPVYIDSNGTKLRILSTFNDVPQVSEARADIGQMVTSEDRKLSNHFLKKKMNKKKKKKKHHALKHLKQLKLAPQISSFSQRPYTSQVCVDVEGNNREKRSSEKVSEMPKQIKLNDSGTLRPWVCSKKRGITKKVSGQGDHQPVKCRFYLPQDLLRDPNPNDRSFSEACFADRSYDQKLPVVADRPIHKGQASEKRESSFGLKRICNITKKSFLPMKRNSSQLSKDGTSINNSSSMPKSPNSTRSQVSSLSSKSVDKSTQNLEVPPVACTKSWRSSQVKMSKAKRFSCFEKVQLISKRDKELAAYHSEDDGQCDMDHDTAESEFECDETADMSFARASSLEARPDGGMKYTSQRGDALSLQNLKCEVHECRVNTADMSFLDGDSCEGGIAKKQTGLQSEDIVSELSPKNSDVRSAVSTSPELYKLSDPKKQSNYFQSSNDFNELLCGTEAATSIEGEDFINEKGLFSTDVGNRMIGQNADTGLEMDSEAALRSSFPEVDPIPIPGPPGSFLPSPRDMGSEDFQGNSSLATGRGQSPPYDDDIIDADSSESPISATSMISNPTGGRSDDTHSQPSFSLGHCALQDYLSGFTAAAAETLVRQGCGAQLPLTRGTEVERSACDVGFLKLDKISIEKGSLSFKNDQPCCCQRKSIALNNQESQLVRHRKLTLLTGPAIGKQTSGSLLSRSTSLDSRSELVSPSTIQASDSDDVVVPIIKPSTGSIPLKDSSLTGVRVMVRADCDSDASPSTTNPVLRLMGKNLMVVQKDGDASTPVGPTQPHPKNDIQAFQLPTFSNVSSVSILNRDCYNIAGQGSLVFGQDPRNMTGPYLDPRFTQSCRGHPDPIFSQAPDRPSMGVFQVHQTAGFAMSMKPPTHRSDNTFSSRQNSLRNAVSMLGSYQTEKGTVLPDHLCKHTNSSIYPAKEIIAIDDVHQGKTPAVTDFTRYTEGWKRSQLFTPSMSIVTGTNYSPSVRFFSCEQAPLGESPVCSAGYHGTPSRPVTTNSGAWGSNNVEGPRVLPQSPFVVAASSSGLPRSSSAAAAAALYDSPGFS